MKKKERKKKTHRGPVYTKKSPKKKRQKKQKIGAIAGDIGVWETSLEAHAPTTAEKQEIIDELEVCDLWLSDFVVFICFKKTGENIENLDLQEKDLQKRAALVERLHFIIMGAMFRFFFFEIFENEVPLQNFLHLSKISKKKKRTSPIL